MTAYVLAPITGDGTEETPFGVDGARAIIDLRPDSTVADGWALALLTEDADKPADAVELVDSRLPDAATERIPKQARDKVMDRLGLNLDSEQLGAMAAEILLSGKEDGSRWLPLRRQADGWWRVFLGGLLWAQESIDGGAVAFDTFDRADDSTSLGTADSGQVWETIRGTQGIDSNQAYTVNTQSGIEVGISHLDSGAEDGYAAADITFDTNSGLVFRSLDRDNFMLARLRDDKVQLYRRESANFTLLAETAMTLIRGQVYAFRVEFSGSSIEILVDEDSKVTATDSFQSTVTQHGLYGVDQGDRWDDFAVNHVTAAIAHGLTLSHAADATATVEADAAHGLTLAHTVDATATVKAAVAHGLTLAHAVTAGSAWPREIHLDGHLRTREALAGRLRTREGLSGSLRTRMELKGDL